jgi:hypothetical protein
LRRGRSSDRRRSESTSLSEVLEGGRSARYHDNCHYLELVDAAVTVSSGSYGFVFFAVFWARRGDTVYMFL